MADTDNTAPSRADQNKQEAHDRAEAKWAPELRVIENIADNFFLPDAEAVTTGLTRGPGIGFTGTEAGGIRFEGTTPDEDEYRGSSEEHAVKFAKAFNNALVARDDAGRAVGYLARKGDIAKVDGNVVTFDLGGLRDLLQENTIADQLPKLAKGYSKQYIIEKGNAQVDRMVDMKIAQRQMDRQKKKVHAKVVKELEGIIEESPSATNERLQKLTATDPQFAQLVRTAFKEILEKAGEYNASEQNPEALEGVGEEYLPLVKRAAERLDRRDKKMRGEEGDAPEAANDAAPEADAAEAATSPRIRDIARSAGQAVGHAAREATRRAAGGKGGQEL